ncbi:class I SAM-dependent methyltransferase [Chitinophaga barathri]|uniref:Class I SAM-dependent methyltransferase n=1 Tax=Chitinophaga barathri TaxID=1647451 RepID=A0A3N4MDX5_9BACT|nr:class I SAM-dependent methyltransferase [Chitinophaga barathri]RPD42162.1 class I SAM-dependent methyltransferase [Chitinophaga barathri]
MQQNKYDDPSFFENYSRLPRSTAGLEGAGEWPVFSAMLPPLAGKTVLDLGCGYGWHCRYAREQGAKHVTGVDISAKMIELATSSTSDPAIEYLRMAVEDISFEPGSFDVVISSLTLHYIQNLGAVTGKVFQCLRPGGSFVFSVEHPIFTSRPEQDWHYGPNGERLHWPLDHYQSEGLRHTHFLDSDDVIKYHRTVSTYINTLTDAGFRIKKLAEPGPAPEVLARYPEMKDENRRPIFLLAAADKT